MTDVRFRDEGADAFERALLMSVKNDRMSPERKRALVGALAGATVMGATSGAHGAGNVGVGTTAAKATTMVALKWATAAVGAGLLVAGISAHRNRVSVGVSPTKVVLTAPTSSPAPAEAPASPTVVDTLASVAVSALPEAGLVPSPRVRGALLSHPREDAGPPFVPSPRVRGAPLVPSPRVRGAPLVPSPRVRGAPLVPSPRTRPASHDDLPAEIRLVERARTALSSGDLGAARGALAEHDRAFPRGALADEVAVLHIDFLGQSGDREQAVRAARVYLSAHPKSPHAPRLRALLEGTP